jgi:hypothetical protein
MFLVPLQRWHEHFVGLFHLGLMSEVKWGKDVQFDFLARFCVKM